MAEFFNFLVQIVIYSSNDLFILVIFYSHTPPFIIFKHRNQNQKYVIPILYTYIITLHLHK